MILKYFSIKLCQGYIYECTSSSHDAMPFKKKKKAVTDLAIGSFS